jgi:hypothetical protein
MMRLVAIAVVLGVTGCAARIGDPCSTGSDCSDDGLRICDRTSPGGYCTQAACDYDTCPGEAVCVRFFSIGNASAICASTMDCADGQVCSPAGGCVPPSVRTCNPDLEDRQADQDNCTFDEICTFSGVCVPQNAELRFCMNKCDNPSGCRDGYECRDADLMKIHGGQPAIDPTAVESTAPQAFCAAAP